MGSPIVGGVLGAANVIGGIAQGNAQRAQQNAQAKQQAKGLQASLLIQQQQLIDTAHIEDMQLRAARLFAAEQAANAQLNRTAEADAFTAAQRLQDLQQQMAVAEGRFQNQAALSAANIQDINAKSQASAERLSAEQTALTGQSQAADIQRQTAQQVQQGTQAAQKGFAESERVGDTLFTRDPSGASSQAQQTALFRERFAGAGEALRQGDITTDEAALQAQYIKGITSTLRELGISQADALEAASAVTNEIARAGYDLNNLNLDSLLALAKGERGIQAAQFELGQAQAKRAQEFETTAQQFSLNTAEATSRQNLASGLQSIQAQAKAGAQFGASSPGFLGSALQVASGAYSIYDKFRQAQPPQQPQQQAQFGISNVRMPSLLATPTYQYPQQATYSIGRF